MLSRTHLQALRRIALALAVVWASAGSMAAPSGDTSPRVAVLVYHRFAQTATDSMTVRVDTFEAQLRFLREHGYRFVPLSDVVAWLDGERPNLPPASLADNPNPTKAPALSSCIDEYKAGNPLSSGCPVNTPDLAFKAEMRECIDLFRAGKRLKTWCPLDTPQRAAAESSAPANAGSPGESTPVTGGH